MEKAQKSLKKAEESGYGYDFQDDLMNALPSVAPKSPNASKQPPATVESQIVRRAHDKAMKVLQTH